MADLILPTSTIEAMKHSDVIAFEGFEMTGKSHLLQQVYENFSFSVKYRPDWEGSLSDKVVRRGNRYIPGLSILGLWKQMDCQFSRLLLDRWLAVSIVYMKMYNQASDCQNIDDLVNAFRTAADGLHPIIIHKSHTDMDEAIRMYDLSKKDSDHEDVYDKFSSFEEYYEAYKNFNDEYLWFYENKCPFPVFNISSYHNHFLHYWEGVS